MKDNVDIVGHKTSLCNRAWLDLYPEASENAVCISSLIHAGAVVAGKVKLVAMIMREEPMECVESYFFLIPVVMDIKCLQEAATGVLQPLHLMIGWISLLDLIVSTNQPRH